MKLEDFIQIFYPQNTQLTEKQKQQAQYMIDYVQKQNNLLDSRINMYIQNIPENLKLPEEQKQIKEFLFSNISAQDEMNIQIIQWNFTNACFSILKKARINPFVYTIPSDFLKENQIERLQDYGNALDKYLYIHWVFFRQFFEKKRSFQYEFKQLMDMIVECANEEKLNKLCVDNKLLLENYATYNTLLQNKIEYYKTKLEYDISFIVEYISQILQDREQIKILQVMISQIVDKLTKYPLLVQELVQQSIYRLVCFLDLQSFDLVYNPPHQTILLQKYRSIVDQDPTKKETIQKIINELEKNKEKEIMIGLSVPRAILSQLYDPMKNKQYKKQEKDTIQKKSKQYNDLITGLPAWNILQTLKGLKYFDYKCEREKLEQAILQSEHDQGKMRNE